MRITLTVYFDEPFWVGLFERYDEDRLTVARVVFGAEPSEKQVNEFVLTGLAGLRFSPPVSGVREVKIADNPKRRQRQAAQAQTRGVSTKSQQALQLAREELKLDRKQNGRERREAEKERKLELHIIKKKEKHRGH